MLEPFGKGGSVHCYTPTQLGSASSKAVGISGDRNMRDTDSEYSNHSDIAVTVRGLLKFNQPRESR